MFNLILDEPPTHWRGHELRTDFRQGLKYYRIVAEDHFSDETKLNFCIRALFSGDVRFTRADITALVEFFSWYLSGGEEAEEPSGKKVFDFNVDHGRLYSAFWQTYGINLRTSKMHWWEFLELFAGLSSETLLMKVTELRGQEVPKKGNPKQRQKILKAKRIFSLEKKMPAEKRAEAQNKRLQSFFDRW